MVGGRLGREQFGKRDALLILQELFALRMSFEYLSFASRRRRFCQEQLSRPRGPAVRRSALQARMEHPVADQVRSDDADAVNVSTFVTGTTEGKFGDGLDPTLSESQIIGVRSSKSI